MPLSSEFLSAFVSFLLTVLILSYVIRDNPLFRATIYIFVGISAGYVAAVAWYQVIWPLLLRPFVSGSAFQNPLQGLLLLIPLALSGLMLSKLSARFSWLGRPSMAYLVGVSAAAAIGGAVIGTLFPQIQATINGFDINLAVARNLSPFLMIINGALILLGVVSTLIYFHFGAQQKNDGTKKRNILIEIFTWVGRVYIAITFGVLFAGVYMAALTALIERVDALRNFIFSLIG